MKVAVVGAGLLGRLVAWRALQAQAQVTIYDPDPTGKSSCSWVGAGMLSPISELELAEPIIADLGLASMQLYKNWVPLLDPEVHMAFEGTVVVHHHQDRADCQKFLQRLDQKMESRFNSWAPQRIELKKVEPQLAEKFEYAYYIPDEGQIHARALLDGLMKHLKSAMFCDQAVDPESLLNQDFDWVIDCRGLGSTSANLRGVRGELVHLHNPHFRLQRAVRIMHPRYPIYVVPRPNQRFIVGATSIESDSMEPIHLVSMLELLSAAFSIHSSFAEAQVLEQAVQCRPAFADNLPQICVQKNLIRANGLYRHGYLIGPAIAADIVKYIGTGKEQPTFTEIWRMEN